MPVLATRIKETWLDKAVPTTLEELADYQVAITQVGDFIAKLDSLRWPGVNEFRDWVVKAPKIWLGKKRETSLDWTRNQLSLGKPYWLEIEDVPQFHPLVS